MKATPGGHSRHQGLSLVLTPSTRLREFLFLQKMQTPRVQIYCFIAVTLDRNVHKLHMLNWTQLQTPLLNVLCRDGIYMISYLQMACDYVLYLQIHRTQAISN